jgi:hypothetical protein
MISITHVEKIEEYILLEYTKDNLVFDTRVYNYFSLTAQEIVKKGFEHVKPLFENAYYHEMIALETEEERESYIFDFELQQVNDEIIDFDIVTVNNILFTEGDNPIVINLECIGITKFGQLIDFTDDAVFYPSKQIVVNTDRTYTQEISAEVEGFKKATKSFTITYRSLEDIERDRQLSNQELQRKIQHLEELLADLASLQLGVE